MSDEVSCMQFLPVAQGDSRAEGGNQIGGTQVTDDVALESLYGAFGCIASVVVGFDELDGCHKCSNGSCGLIVGDVVCWFVSFGYEDIEICCACLDDIITLCQGL